MVDTKSSSKNELMQTTKRPMVSILYVGQAPHINITDFDAGWTMLQDKIFFNTLKSSDITNLTPSEIDHKDKYGQSALWIACCNNSLPYIKMLQNAGGDLKQKDNQDRTLLHAAVSCPSNYEVCKNVICYLLENGVDINSRDVEGNSAIDDLEIEPNPVNSETMYRYEIKKKLLGTFTTICTTVTDASTSSSSKNELMETTKRPMVNILYYSQAEADLIWNTDHNAGWTKLQHKIYCDNLKNRDVATLLPINVNHKDSFGQSALWIACYMASLPCVKMLHNAGGDPKQKDNEGRTLLHAVVSSQSNYEDRKNVICYLLENGVDITCKDTQGNTVIDDLKKKSSSDSLRSMYLDGIKQKLLLFLNKNYSYFIITYNL
jgi:ankyrin repeat protein